MNNVLIKLKVSKNFYIVLIILHVWFNGIIVGEPDLTIVANKNEDNSGFTFRCIAANTSVTSAIYWTDKNENILIGRNAILPKPDYEETFEDNVDYLWEVDKWSVENSENVEIIKNIPLTDVRWEINHNHTIKNIIERGINLFKRTPIKNTSIPKVLKDVHLTPNIKDNVLRNNLDYYTKPNRFLFSNSSSEQLDVIGPKIPRKQKSFCLSLFYTVCSKCSLKIAIQIDSTDVLIKKELLPSNSSDNEWIYKKISRPDILVGEFVQIYFTKSKQGEILEENQFWAIDNIRTCTESEILINTIRTDTLELKCNILEEDNFKIDGNLKCTYTNDNELCEPGYIGLNCTINCDLLEIPFCKKTVICNNLGCNCPSGFKPPNCLKKCDKGFWGYNCKERCAPGCENKKCNHITGHCTCSQGYTGKNCAEKFPVLDVSPETVNLSYTFIYVKQGNLTYKGTIIPKYIHFLYKRVSNDSNGKQEWIDVKECQVVYPKSPELPIFCNITNLSISTYYTLKVLLYTEDNNTQVNAPLLNLSTKCKVITDSLIKIEPLLKTATLKIVNLDDYYCDLKDYEMVLSNGKTLNLNRTVEIENLLPSTEYTVTIRSDKYKFEKKINFITKCDIPQIEDIRSNNISKSLKIEWKLRSSKKCITDYYVVLRELKPHYCLTFKNTTVYAKNISNEYVYIPNVKPFYDYQVTISGQNVSKLKKETRKYNLEFTTKPEDIHTTNISPKAVKFDSDKDLVNITLPSCKEVFGPLKFNMKFDCLSDWCKSFTHTITTEEISEEYDSLTKSFKVINVRPYTEYNLTVQTQMLNHTNKFIKTLKIKTKPGIPPLVTNAVIYSRSNHSLWLRWKPPYPQYGELEKFIIFCTEDYINFIKMNVSSKMGCNFWFDEKYICKEIKDLKYNTTYHIRIAAKNKNVKKINNTSLFGTTIQAASSPPLNITIIRLFDYKINLLWHHPDITNGPLKSFEITIEADNVTKKNVSLDIQSPKKQYYFNISVEPAKTYNVTVFPKNEFLGQPAWIIFDTDPPAPDLKDDPYIICKENNCKIILPDPKIFYSNRFVFIKYKFGNKSEIKQPTKMNNNTIEIDKKMLEKITFLNDTNYIEKIKRNVIVEIENRYKNKTATRSFKLIQDEIKVDNIKKSHLNNLFFLLLLLVFPVAIVLFFFWRKSKASNTAESDVQFYLNTSIRSNNSKIIRKKQATPTQEEEEKLFYENISNINVLSKLIRVDDLTEHIKQNIAKSGNVESEYEEELNEFQKEYALVPRDAGKPCTFAALNVNRPKNRYKNILPFDESRVILNNSETAYINASYIDGYDCVKAYIATQGPKDNTVADFWAMIWQENVTDIVMVANIFENGKKKCEEYWDDDGTLTIGSFQITSHATTTLPNYVQRKFDVQFQKEQRTINHLQFISWPDHGVPIYTESMAQFLQKVLLIPQGKNPVVVHCSGGVGRTGTIILCDINLRMAAKEKKVDFLKTLHDIRQQRINLVDSSEQYIFAHFAVLECLFGKNFQQKLDSNFETNIKKLFRHSFLKSVMDYLDEIAWRDKYQSLFPNEKNKENAHKNRFSIFIPEGKYAIFLPRYPIDDNNSDYINAMYVNAYNAPCKFIVTQQPLPATIGDFWRLVAEKKVSLIISLNTINLDDKTSCIFWPENDCTLQPVDFIKIANTGVNNNEIYTEINLEMSVTNNSTRKVSLIQLKDWESSRDYPQSIDNLLNVLALLQDAKQNILITCHNGVTASGLFIALYNMIEQMKLEKICDICQSVRMIRRSRQEFVQPWGQFEFLLKAALAYNRKNENLYHNVNDL